MAKFFKVPTDFTGRTTHYDMSGRSGRQRLPDAALRVTAGVMRLENLELNFQMVVPKFFAN
jgi:hypothetical protein